MQQTSSVQNGVIEPDCPIEIMQFMESDEGKKFLDGIRHYLKGLTITDVEFNPTDTGITTNLIFTEGEYFPFNDEELSLDTLRGQFGPLFRRFAAKARE
ncbi:MAG: hypothetical protein HZB26_00590 [Candidatus Hydrogenedentes bacterium]|nr:hypothetical protein [Candidatus Hydrogenedentota bacterium]